MAKRKDYVVGYGKPPKQHRFKKGESGNPCGRPKKEKRDWTMRAIRNQFLAALDEELTIREGDKKRKMAKHEVIVKKVLAQAISGDHRSQKLVLEMEKEWMLDLEEWRVKFLDIAEEMRLAAEERARLKVGREAAASKAAEKKVAEGQASEDKA